MPAERPWQVYAAAGWGSVLAEAALAWSGASFEIVDVTGFDEPGESRTRLCAVNPLAQVPTVVTPQGQVMTESAAIVLLLAETFPTSRLAPAPGDADRADFLRKLQIIASAIYPTFTYDDYPQRWVDQEAELLKQRVGARRQALWQEFEALCGEGPWALGAQPSAIDIFLSVMTRWRPGRDWFAANCPRLLAIAVAADALPQLQSVWRRNFPKAFAS